MLCLLTRDSIYRLQSALGLYAIARPSVRPSVTLVDQSETVKVRVMRLSPQSSPLPLVFAVYVYPEIPTGSPERGRQTRVGWGKQAIL